MIEELTREYLKAVDRALPGYVRALYVVGSVALAEWRRGISDVDTVIMTSRPASGQDVVQLTKIHSSLPRSPHFDGVYLEPALAKSWPTDRRVVPFVVNGEFKTDKPCGELTPVLWLTLRRYGIAVRGVAVAQLGIRVDPVKLRRYCLDNLREYWQATVAWLLPELADVAPDAAVEAETVSWFVFGPARLHYTLAHGDIISKTAAAEYLSQVFPQYTYLAKKAIRWRAGEAERFTANDIIVACDSVNVVANDAWRRFGEDAFECSSGGSRRHQTFSTISKAEE
ncbi:nucleotidyltransferase domain-containing protein [Micromonospora sp. C95]|uniref:nucleotidyltransferase domain-containing protein n=1 Tax=Micromonospora sp. C95 TaxID=2824882 RepID=UPI001B38D5BE|nr:nucleotidyltransferase domain-containing protein [Micromonospora sp. C95]MBQ1026184.1 nucleotidyltransferase domain-containing protein [Micromonospora sp. C95]